MIAVGAYPNHAMRILIVKLSSLGDILHALPAVHALRKATGARIDWLTQTEYGDLVSCFPDVDRVISINRRRPWHEFRSWRRGLRAQQYDLVVDLQGLLKSALLAKMARSTRRLGPSFHREGSRLFYHETAGPRDRRRHAVEENLDVLKSLGISRPENIVFPLRFASVEPAYDRPIVGMAPVSRWPSKNWPAENFAALADRLQKEFGATILLLGSGADREEADRIASLCKISPINLCGTLSLPQLGGCTETLDLLVSNDSGPVHLAAALGIPCVVFYGPTEPGRTAPWGGIHAVLTPAVACTGCYRRICRSRDGHCLAALSADTVFDEIRRGQYLT